MIMLLILNLKNIRNQHNKVEFLEQHNGEIPTR